MATTKAKTAKKSGAKKTSAKSKAASSKPKTVKAVEAKTTKKAKVTTVDKVQDEAEKVAEEKVKIVSAKSHPIKEFFARKFDASENILTIFKDTKIIGAIIGEIIGTGVIAAIALTLGLLIFGYLGVTLAVFTLSGAHLNPVITVGMMASRRVSAIRGILYLIAQVIGAWAGFAIVNGFYNAGIASGNIAADNTTLPALTATSDLAATTEGFSFFWAITILEFVGAIIIAFFYARALAYKRSAFTFAATVSTGVFLALLFAVVITGTYLGIQGNSFVLNPAVAFMYGVLPGSAEGFDALMNALMPMLVTYALFPVLGGVVGFYLSDFASKLSGKELAN